jgi:hypothetical protein
MRIVAALVCLLAAAPAAAQNANRVAEQEARTWLKPCKERTKDLQGLCLQNQGSFIEQYIYAKAGDPSAMGSTSASFRKTSLNDPDYYRIGMPQSLVQSCAWQAVRMASTRGQTAVSGQRDAMDSICAPLSMNEAAAAIERANRLLFELRTNPARMPADD